MLRVTARHWMKAVATAADGTKVCVTKRELVSGPHGRSDFLDYFHDFENFMLRRFNIMNDWFDDIVARYKSPAAAAADQKPSHAAPPTTDFHYSKTVTRSFSSSGNIAEETIMEHDSDSGKEVKSVTRRIGDRAIQHVETKDLHSGMVKTSTLREAMHEADEKSFDDEWTKLSKSFLPSTRHLISESQRAHHEATRQLDDQKQTPTQQTQ